MRRLQLDANNLRRFETEQNLKSRIFFHDIAKQNQLKGKTVSDVKHFAFDPPRLFSCLVV